MKLNLKFWALLLLLAPFVLTAQEVPSIDPNAPLPTDKAGFWAFAIAGITPLIVWGVSKLPKVPKPFLPTITPFVGIGLGHLMNWLGAAELGWVDMAQAGALAVFVREVVNQWVTKQMAGDDSGG